MLRRAFGMQAFTIQDARLGRFYLCDRVIDDVGCRVGVLFFRLCGLLLDRWRGRSGGPGVCLDQWSIRRRGRGNICVDRRRGRRRGQGDVCLDRRRGRRRGQGGVRLDWRRARRSGGGESFCLCVSLTSGLLPLLRSVQVWRRGPTESRDVVVEWSQWL